MADFVNAVIKDKGRDTVAYDVVDRVVTARDYAECCHPVRFPFREYPTSVFNVNHINEMKAWCQDESRPGKYLIEAVFDATLSHKQSLALTFNFSDENTAFEFRMRWG